MHNRIQECHGFGPLYSGIFIISGILTIYMIYKFVRERKFETLVPYLLIIFGMVILILATDGSWWARYTPYLYLLPIFNVIYLVNRKNKISKIMGIALSILLIVNVSIIIYANCSAHLQKYTTIKKELSKFEDYANSHSYVSVALKTTGHEGLKFNIADLNIDIEKVRYVKKIEKNKKNAYYFSYCEEK